MSFKIVRFSLPFLSLFVVSCGLSDEDYDAMAKSYCECMNKRNQVTKIDKLDCIDKVKKESEDLFLNGDPETFEEKFVEALNRQEGCSENAKIIR